MGSESTLDLHAPSLNSAPVTFHEAIRHQLQGYAVILGAENKMPRGTEAAQQSVVRTDWAPVHKKHPFILTHIASPPLQILMNAGSITFNSSAEIGITMCPCRQVTAEDPTEPM
eukprot:CAMPEP_0204501972 /NCGR_PEP_ID=MMETSP0471-20130131/100372_1 /ASSEMBLY_ACC=CAM_ASM_000602 /TAXON_ID=2969 /ORGANISM="Oxyrrhis marina" /LENGTH=113 /DNA_ID=CAMNT_0051506693 /DNA_START=731 /DNA_END=1073 /DNA_ORIENTATION=+